MQWAASFFGQSCSVSFTSSSLICFEIQLEIFFEPSAARVAVTAALIEKVGRQIGLGKLTTQVATRCNAAVIAG